MSVTTGVTASAQDCAIGSLELESGARLPDVVLGVETYGRLAGDATNAVLVCPSLTRGAHAAGGASDGRPAGWWDAAIGPGRMLDTDEWFVICADPIGTGRSTRPASPDPRAGRPYGGRFPVFTVRDIADGLVALLPRLGIDRLALAIGGCLGGQEVLELAARAPDAIACAAAIAATPASSAHTIAIMSVMRHLIRADPRFRGGDYYDDEPPLQGLRDAVVAAMPLWMSRQAMEDRFGRRTRNGRRYTLEPEFEIEWFMKRVGHTVQTEIDPNSLLYLTRAVEYFDLPAEYGSLATYAETVSARTLLVSYSSDWRYPSAEVDELREVLVDAGRDARHVILDARQGHGSFMYDVDGLRPVLEDFWAGGAS